MAVDAQTGADFFGFFAPKDDDDAPTASDTAAGLTELVYATIAAQRNGTVATSRTLLALLRQLGHGQRDTAVRDALDDLVVAGRVVEIPGKRGARGYQAVPEAADHSTESAK